MAKNKDPLFFNKVMAAVLLSGLIAAFSGVIGRLVYSPDTTLEEAAFVLPGSDETVSSSVVTLGDSNVGPGAISDLFSEVTIADGQIVARKCQACHTFDVGGADKIGPNLFGVFGSAIGQLSASFKYSDSLLAVGGTWTEEKLNQFLYDPRSLASTTKMTFVGLKNDKDRAAVILFLKSLK